MCCQANLGLCYTGVVGSYRIARKGLTQQWMQYTDKGSLFAVSLQCLLRPGVAEAASSACRQPCLASASTSKACSVSLESY